MQRLTTKVPDESMLEVAIVAVNVCLSEEPPRSPVFSIRTVRAISSTENSESVSGNRGRRYQPGRQTISCRREG